MAEFKQFYPIHPMMQWPASMWPQEENMPVLTVWWQMYEDTGNGLGVRTCDVTLVGIKKRPWPPTWTDLGPLLSSLLAQRARGGSHLWQSYCRHGQSGSKNSTGMQDLSPCFWWMAHYPAMPRCIFSPLFHKGLRCTHLCIHSIWSNTHVYGKPLPSVKQGLYWSSRTELIGTDASGGAASLCTVFTVSLGRTEKNISE